MSDIFGGGAPSEWEVNGNGDLVPKDGEPVSVETLRNASEEDIGERPIYLDGDTTINVPGDQPTIQDAVNQIPLYVERGQVVINIDDGTYDEDVIIPPFIAKRVSVSQGEGAAVNIYGNSTTPSNVRWGSLFMQGTNCANSLYIEGVAFGQENPHDDENVCVANYGGAGSILLNSCEFVDAGGAPENGIIAYSGRVGLAGVDFGSNVLSGDAVTSKYFGEVYGTPNAGGQSGTVGGYAYVTKGAGKIAFAGSTSSLTGSTGLVDINDGGSRGEVLDYERKRTYNSKPSTRVKYAEHYPGSDPDTRLDNCLSDAEQGDTIILEKGNYTTDRNIGNRLTLKGAGQAPTDIDATWTLDSIRVTLKRVEVLSGGGIQVSGEGCIVRESYMSSSTPVTVDGDGFRFAGNKGGDLTFNSGATGGIVDGCTGTSFTDNDGGNTQGDIA